MPLGILDAPVNRFSGKRLISVYPGKHRKVNANIGPSQTLALGTILGLTVGATNDAQTVNLGGTPTGGTFTVSVPFPGKTMTTGLIAYNAAAAGTETGVGTPASPFVSLQGALQALLGAGNATVTGSAQPGNTQTVTFKGAYAAMPMPALTVSVAALTGGTPSAAVVHAVTGVTANTYVPYATAGLAAPAAAPSLTAPAGTLLAAQVTVGYTYVNGAGETTLSPLASLAADGSHKITVGSIAIPAGATAINYYVSTGGPLFYLTQLTAAAAQDVTTTTLAAGSPQVFPPDTNTTVPAAAILEYDVATDAVGNVTFGLQSGSEWGQTYPAAPCYLNGEFQISELVGLDANALKLLRGRMISGTLGSGVGVVHIP